MTPPQLPYSFCLSLSFFDEKLPSVYLYTSLTKSFFIVVYIVLVSITEMIAIRFLTKTTAAQNEDALSYHRVRGLYFQAVNFVATMDILATYWHSHCHSFFYRSLVISYQLKLIKVRAKLTNLNHCAVPFLSRSGVNLC